MESVCFLNFLATFAVCSLVYLLHNIEIRRTGDFTAGKYEKPEESMEEIAEELRRITAEEQAKRMSNK
jgi:hypothetical protein